MSDLVLDRADLWPVGTVVSAYDGDAPRLAAVDSATVASNGTLTLDDLVDGKAYTLTDGVNELRVRKASVFVPRDPWPWKAVVAARRTALGTS